ncbi:MAG: 2-succinyl-5-enolpyruvyl-6-hydroxy-3-cyclohexene-1-carboxylic-acid synthase [Actinomycetales bacterium]|nr:2-succinyl-5-enolpyruvyl-6-hydroxy-3-cyclohexene-1-carboxylic-acid synthase [Actinomycetales bacterium]
MLLEAFVARGLTDLVLSPGSRSQALALEAARLERDGALRLHVRIDERVGCFTALGIARESGAPVLVVTTSGTAVAELHAATLEAAHAGVPLVLLTADRPAELHGTGSNQTTAQVGLFGPLVPVIDVEAPGADPAADPDRRAAGLVDDVLARIARRPGPVQLNLAFREPLSGPSGGEGFAPAAAAPETVEPAPEAVEPAERSWAFRPGPEIVELAAVPGTVVVAGADAGAEAEELARALSAPLLAEVSSGARFGPHLVPAYRELLRTEGLGDRIERVVVFGHPTLSREIPELLRRPGLEVVVVRGRALEPFDPARSARLVDGVRATGPGHPTWGRSWVGRWVHASRALLEQPEPPAANLSDDYAKRSRFARAQLEVLREPVTRRLLVEAVWNATWPHDRLVLGASRLIRVLDGVATGRRITVHANRGLAGIDGTVATATGVALAAARAEAPGLTRVLLGDLALQHDVGALLPVAGEQLPPLQVIVGDDGGGTIFDGLEVAGNAERELFDRVMYTPHAMDLAALAAANGWEHRLVTTRGDLEAGLAPSPGRVLVEVRLAR